VEALGLRAITLREIQYETPDNGKRTIPDGELIVVDPKEGIGLYGYEHFPVDRGEYVLVN
jgi:hypothetical protein